MLNFRLASGLLAARNADMTRRSKLKDRFKIAHLRLTLGTFSGVSAEFQRTFSGVSAAFQLRFFSHGALLAMQVSCPCKRRARCKIRASMQEACLCKRHAKRKPLYLW
jgi:hypothetical protein